MFVFLFFLAFVTSLQTESAVAATGTVTCSDANIGGEGCHECFQKNGQACQAKEWGKAGMVAGKCTGSDDKWWEYRCMKETAIGSTSCYLPKAGKNRMPRFTQEGHGCLKGDYTSHGKLHSACDCYQKCLEENCELIAYLDDKCWTSKSDEWGACSGYNVFYTYEESIIRNRHEWYDYCECSSGYSCSNGKCRVDTDTSCSDKKWSWGHFGLTSSQPCGGTTSEMTAQVAMVHEAPSHHNYFVLGSAALGLGALLYGAGMHFCASKQRGDQMEF